MTKRALCPTCQRPLKTCLCAYIVTRDSDYILIILQDPTEAKHALSSAPLLAQSIIQSRLIVGDVFTPEQLFEAEALLQQNWQRHSLLVFPADEQHPALSTSEVERRDFKTLIILDGTWRKVGRLLKLNPWLEALPRLALNSEPQGAVEDSREPPLVSQYKIRKSPRADGLSTIEAAVATLNALHSGKRDFSPILGAFQQMIEFQIEAMGAATFAKNYEKNYEKNDAQPKTPDA